ncbi:MAG: RHS repeat protein [Opitutales bacterium]|nr:RHS repeat protein [Opitutales bacterium]
MCYDKNGNLTGRKDANNNQWNTVYDSHNRKIAEISLAVKKSDNSFARPMARIIYET